jgi:hypothetical protein
MPSLYQTTPETGTVSSANSTSLYSNTTDFTTGLVNSSVYSVIGGTGVTVNPNTGNVVVSIGQPVAVTDNVTFATLTTTGNATVGGDLTVTGTDISTGIIETPIVISRTTASTGGGSQAALTLKADSTGTPVVGFGTRLNYQVETASGTFKDAGLISVLSADITPGSEDFSMRFGLMRAGATATNVLSIFGNTGDVVMANGGELSIQGATSGSTNIGAPATGSTLTYVLPGAQGAASTVLTNDGSGNLTWALPGGSGSTFGNITIAIDTANTISTTTGDLLLTSATGFVTVPSLIIDSQASIDTATLTTTSTATVTLTSSTRNVMNVLVRIVQGANVHCVNATVLETSASTAMLTTYGEMYNTTPLANFTADTSGGAIRLRVTPTSATSTVFSAVRTSLT